MALPAAVAFFVLFGKMIARFGKNAA